MIEKINAFILSAGLGERMKPITDHIPKPLLPILGKPSLQYVIESVSAIGVEEIFINLHHKEELIEDWLNSSNLKDSFKIKLLHEKKLLGTGGALKNAEAYLKNNHFLVHNSDIFTDIDLQRLIQHHLSGHYMATLAIHDNEQYNKLLIDQKGFLVDFDRGESQSKLYAFTGISVYSPDFLKFLPHGFSNLVNGWLNAISKGAKIACLKFSGHKWSDIGTPSTYSSTIIKELKKNGESIYIHPSIDFIGDIDFDGYLVIEKDSYVAKDSYFKNCILLPGSQTKGKIKYENCIIGKDFVIKIPEKVFAATDKVDDQVVIGEGGSDRRYYRIRRENESFVLMKTTEKDLDFKRQIELTNFFYDIGISVPKLIEVNYNDFSAIFEDLGDISLYKWLKIPRSDEEIEIIYRKVLNCLILIHIESTKNAYKCHALRERIFDYEHLRWESRYFIENFIISMQNFDISDIDALYSEFHRLAVKIDSFQKVVIHRDFQSQNIMIKNKTIRVIDYQGARIGPMAYDLASLLWDPYYRLNDSIRDRLLKYYIDRVSTEASAIIDFSEDRFKQELILCRLHRHMQALGAYGFLSKVKGKVFFMKYIPEAVRLLKDDIKPLKTEYPTLYNLILRL